MTSFLFCAAVTLTSCHVVMETTDVCFELWISGTHGEKTSSASDRDRATTTASLEPVTPYPSVKLLSASQLPEPNTSCSMSGSGFTCKNLWENMCNYDTDLAALQEIVKCAQYAYYGHKSKIFGSESFTRWFRHVAARVWESARAMFLPPATKLGQGYVFTGVCDSVHRGGVPDQVHPPPGPGTPLGPGTPPTGTRYTPGTRYPPRYTPPDQVHPPG